MKCIKCGKEINDTSSYCSECLNDINNDVFFNDEKSPIDNEINNIEKLSLNKGENVETTSNVEDNSSNSIKDKNDIVGYNSNSTTENHNFTKKNSFKGNFKYCVACGEKMHESAKSCNNCGTEAGPLEDNGNLGLAVAGCCIPIIGFILYFVWRDTRVKSAKQCLAGAIIGAVAIPVLYVLFVFITTFVLLGGAGF